MRVTEVRAWAVRIPGPDRGLTAAAGLGDPNNPARPTALEVGRALESLDYRWFEAPILAEDLDGYVELAAALTIPIAEGETKRTRHELRPFLERRALDVVQPDVGRAGGISECRRIADLAAAFHRPYAPHLGLSLGLYVAASLQLAAATANFLIFEWQPTMQHWANQLLSHPFVPENGHFAVPDRPGLGTTFRWDALEPFLVR